MATGGQSRHFQGGFSLLSGLLAVRKRLWLSYSFRFTLSLYKFFGVGDYVERHGSGLRLHGGFAVA